MAKGSRPLPLPGLRGPHTRPYWPPTGQKRPPSLAPTGQLTAQRPPTGHLWPPPPPLAREADGTHREKGSHPHTGHPLAKKGTALGGRPSHRPSLAIREAPYRPHWPQWDGDAFARPLTYGRPPAPSPRLATYGSLRPTWPSEAFGHLHPHAPHRAIGTPSDGRPPHPPPTGHPLAIPGTPPLPRLFGSGGNRTGRGAFRVQRVPIRGGPCALSPLWGPLYPYATG